MLVKDFIEMLKGIQNQEAELILAFNDGVDTTDYAMLEDTTNYSGYAYLSVNGYFDSGF